HLIGEKIETIVGRVDDSFSRSERALKALIGKVDVLAGGPPCQGHSDLNNHTRRKDPRNALFETMIRFAQLTEPRFVIIENVPGVRLEKRGVTERGRRNLEAMGYSVAEGVLVASGFGVAQRRRRYFMIATVGDSIDLAKIPRVGAEGSLSWACKDL